MNIVDSSADLIIRPNVNSAFRADPVAGMLQLNQLQTAFSDPGERQQNEHQTKQIGKQMQPLLSRLQASQSHSVLLIFQALDAAGKDSLIRAVFSNQDPAVVKVSSFKAPTEIERRHDFLWRTSKQLPARGELSIFNRSYYEEVLVVRVHENFLNGQYPNGIDHPEQLWPLRYEAIRAHEKQLASNGTMVLKFWLNVSQEEQNKRFLSRLERPKKRWKFNPNDVKEMAYRDAYDHAFVDMVNATSTAHAPWFMIPADDKARARLEVATIVEQALTGLKLDYPRLKPEIESELSIWKETLSK